MICEEELCGVWLRTTAGSGCLLFLVVTGPAAICHADGASTYSSTRSPSPRLIHQVRADEKLWTSIGQT